MLRSGQSLPPVCLTAASDGWFHNRYGRLTNRIRRQFPSHSLNALVLWEVQILDFPRLARIDVVHVPLDHVSIPARDRLRRARADVKGLTSIVYGFVAGSEVCHAAKFSSLYSCPGVHSLSRSLWYRYLLEVTLYTFSSLANAE